MPPHPAPAALRDPALCSPRDMTEEPVSLLIPESVAVAAAGAFLTGSRSLCPPGRGLRFGHLPDPRLPVQTVRRPEGRL